MMQEQVTVAAAQLDCGKVSGRERYESIAKAVRHSASKGAEFVCLPELCSSGYDVFHRLPEVAQRLDGTFITNLRSLAQENRIYIIAGFLECRGRIFHNSAVLVDPEGKVKGVYRKTHLWGKERKHYVSGKELPVFATKSGVCGIEICYDLEFPEPTRVLTLQGAEVIFCPTNNFRPWEGYWDVYLKARAIENGVFIVGANRVGLEGDYDFFGRSAIVAPDGMVLAEAGEGEEIILASLDRKVLETARQRPAYLKEREPQLYRILSRKIDTRRSG